MKIYPSNDVLTRWEKIYVPNNDIFFISKQFFTTHTEVLNNVLMFERKQYFQHSEYNTLKYNNFYGYWNLSKDIDYCIVTPQGWYESLDKQSQILLLEEQRKSKSFAVIENDYLLTNLKWERMSKSEKHDFFISVIDKLKDNIVLSVPTDLPEYLKQIANTYSYVQGNNCFGVVLFMITKNKWILNEWVYAENLLLVMNQKNYQEITTTPISGDVVIWYQNDEPFHAAVCIGHNLYLNKNSQMIWSPTKVVPFETIANDFSDMDYKVYRCQ